MYFTPRTGVVRQRIVRLGTKLDDLCISQDICYVQMTDIARMLTIYRYCTNLLNINCYYCSFISIQKEHIPEYLIQGKDQEGLEERFINDFIGNIYKLAVKLVNTN